jgi:hypothetical protein
MGTTEDNRAAVSVFQFDSRPQCPGVRTRHDGKGQQIRRLIANDLCQLPGIGADYHVAPMTTGLEDRGKIHGSQALEPELLHEQHPGHVTGSRCRFAA